MKLKFLDLTVIQGGAAASSDINPVLPQPGGLRDQAQPQSALDAAQPWTASITGAEGLMPLFRSSDSVALLGETGVITVGVNDLGWVVYDWAPGP